MQKSSPEITYSEWQDALRAAEQDRVEVVPSEWKTRADLEKIWNLKSSTTKIRLQELLMLGRAEVKRFRVANGARGTYPILHYRLIKKK